MIIYGTRNNVVTEVLDAPVTSSAVHKVTLMKEDYIKLSFVDTVNYAFRAGDYVTYNGQNYYLNKDYVPTMKDEATYSYDIQFNAPWYNLDSYIFFFNTYVTANDVTTITKRESDWYITDTAANIISLLIKNTQDDTRDCPCVFNSVFFCEGTTVKTFTFSSTSILAALNNLAKEFELEWWVTVSNGNYYLHFGECDNSVVMSDGAVVFNPDGSRKKNPALRTQLITGQNVSAPSVSQKNELKKKYFVYGSSRNIDQTVDLISQSDGTYATSLVTKRLAMTGNPQTHESNPTVITTNNGYGEEVVIFDDIYPRSDWQVTHVTPHEIQSDEIEGYLPSGEPVYKKYNVYDLRLGSAERVWDEEQQKWVWQVTDANGFSDFVFTLINTRQDVQCIEDVIASGKPLSLKFIIKDVDGTTYTPKLAGFEFELGATIHTNTDQEEFPSLPASYQWYEFQIIKQEVNGYVIPNDTLIPEIGDWLCLFNIKGEFIDANQITNAQTELSDAFSKYYKNLKRDISYTVKPYVDVNVNLKLGDAVTLIFGSTTIVSRISSYEKKIDYPAECSYVISSYVQPSTVNQLKEEVKTITANIANGTAFQLDAEAAQSILNTYGKNIFLSKAKADTANGKITFAQGADIVTTIGTPTFSGDFMGEGWQIDENNSLTIDSLTVRRTMRVFELLIQQVKATGGEIIVTPANGRIKSVVEDGTDYKIEIESDTNGDFGNMFKANDWVRCQRWNNNLLTIRDYWALVTSSQGDFITVPDYFFDDPPEVGDELVLMGNQDDSSGRQGAIAISAATGNPRISVYNGIKGRYRPARQQYDPPSLGDCTKAVLGDLSGISDIYFGLLEGYGLFSDNVYLRGKLAMSNGTLISDELTRITTGLGGVGITLNGADSSINLTAGKTTFTNPSGKQFASFTEEGLQANVVECLDDDGNMRVKLDKDGLKMYYANGQVMKEEIFVFGAGGVTGAMTCYYNENGEMQWKINTLGHLDEGETESGWNTQITYYLSALSEMVTDVKQSKYPRYDWSQTQNTITNNVYISQYWTNDSSSPYSGMWTKADVSGTPPPSAAQVPRLNGWVMNPLTARQSGSNYIRRFDCYQSGFRSTSGITFNPTPNTTKIFAAVSYVEFVFNLTTSSVTECHAYKADGTEILPTDPTPHTINE